MVGTRGEISPLSLRYYRTRTVDLKLDSDTPGGVVL